MNQTARSGTSAPAQLTIPAILNNFPPCTWAFFPAAGLLEGPGRPDAGKPVRSGFFEEKPAVHEEEPHEGRHHQVHADAIPGAPEDDLALDAGMKSTNAGMKPSYQSRKAS